MTKPAAVSIDLTRVILGFVFAVVAATAIYCAAMFGWQNRGISTAGSALVSGVATQMVASAKPAPATWSSRFNVRWSARWDSSPRYLA